MRASTVVLSLTVALSFAAFGACGGDSVESDDNSGGTGGKILDSGDLEAATEAAAEAGPDVQAETGPDAPPDQSVEPDTSVIDAEVLEGSLFDLTMPDVTLMDGATLQGCYDCSVLNCSSEMETCEADDKCRTILLCLFEDQCFGGANGIDYACGMGCSTKAGITSMGDPSVAIALSAGQCISGNCKDDCGLPEDAGI